MGQSQSMPKQDYAEVPHITSAAGKRLYIRSWIPESDTRALCYFCHGVSEYVERYGEMAAVLNKVGVAVYGHDHVGHGRSEGDRVHVTDTSEYVDDMAQRLKSVRDENPGLPMFLLGHSMGGLIAFLTAARHTDLVDFLLLSAPALVADPDVATPFKIAAATWMASLTPQLQVGKLPRKYVCRDPAVIEEIENDPMMWHGGMKAAWSVAMLRAQEEAKALFEGFRTPFLIIHGTGDKICLIDGSRAMYEACPSEDKTLKEFEGGYHELDREPDGMGDEVRVLVADWVEDRI